LWYHSGVEDVRSRIAAKKAELDRVRVSAEKSLAALTEWYDVELTYTSNAIEGNTLTRVETAEVFERGLAGAAVYKGFAAGVAFAVGIEAADERFRAMVSGDGSGPGGRIRGARAAGDDSSIQRRQWAHCSVADELLLMRAGYPPVVIGPEHRVEYLDSLQRLQLEQDSGPYEQFSYERLEASLEDWLNRVGRPTQARRPARAGITEGEMSWRRLPAFPQLFSISLAPQGYL
jgi:Fic family protein